MAIQTPITIPLSGLSTSPSDYSCSDGNLSAAIGVVHEDGAIIPYDEPSILLETDKEPYDAYDGRYDEEVVYFHNNGSNCKNYIVKYTKYFRGERTSPTYGWTSSEELDGGKITSLHEFIDGERTPVLGNEEVSSISSIGNTIIFYTSSSVYTFLFNNGSYQYIGGKMPEIKIRPYLKTSIKKFTDSTNQKEFSTGCDDHAELMSMLTNLSTRSKVNDAVIGKINEMIDTKHKDKKFVMPFLLRVAYRLYDGSVTMHSSPVMMIPTTESLPMAEYFKDTQKFNVTFNEATLMYAIPELAQFKASLEKWKDIIKEVVFAVSAPIYTFDSSEQFNTIQTEKYWIGDDFMISSPSYDKYYWWCQPDDPEEVEHEQFVGTYYMPCAKRRILPLCEEQNQVFQLPKHNRSIVERVKEVSNFYIVSSIKISELEADAEVPIKDTLQNVYAKEAIADDFESHDTIIPSISVSYNNRLNISNYSKICYDNCYLWGMATYQSAAPTVEPSFEVEEGQVLSRTTTFPESRADNTPISFGAAVCITNSSDSTTSIIKLNIPEDIPTDFAIPYLFYANADANRLYIKRGNSVSMYPLDEHDMLNGSFLCDVLSNIVQSRTFSTTDEDLSDEENNVISAISGEDMNTIESFSGYVKTSEVSNPFIFKAENVERIGSGEIIAMVPAAQALSSGQFGQFPMYAFTTEGVWALSVSDTGGWRSKQPISRDVLISPTAILQLDQSVMFATDRGLMHISGSRVECISSVFDGCSDSFSNKYNAHIENVINNHTDLSSAYAVAPFREFLKGCFMHYDYAHQRVYVCNQDYPLSYVFSLKDKLWTTAPYKGISAVNSYPNDVVNIESITGKYLVDFSKSDDIDKFILPSDGFIITRPLKLGAPNTLKTIRSVNVRGQFLERSRVNQPADGHHLSVIVYGTNSTLMDKWHLVGSAKGSRYIFRYGTPYMYFRVAIICKLSEGESIDALEIMYETKETNKPR